MDDTTNDNDRPVWVGVNRLSAIKKYIAEQHPEIDLPTGDPSTWTLDELDAFGEAVTATFGHDG